MNDLLTREELREIRERSQAATPGPWTAVHHPECPEASWSVMAVPDRVKASYNGVAIVGLGANAIFVAHAREDVPRLLRHVAALERRLERVEAAIRRHRLNVWGEGPIDHDEDEALYGVLGDGSDA